MATSIQELQDLQALLVKSVKTRLEQDLEDNIPTDAATLGVIVKMLKDNNISADPADSNELDGLREKLKEQSDARKNRRDNVVQLAAVDNKVAVGG